MIYESYPWKSEILKQIKQMKKYNIAENYDKNTETTCTVIEKCLILSSFIIRKLIECEKLSDDADIYSLQLKAYKPLRNIDRMHRWPNETTHDWENIIYLAALGKDICNWIIHSYILEFVFEENKIISFLVSSDYDKNKLLYEIELQKWYEYLKFIAEDSIVEMIDDYDFKIKDYVVIKKTREYLKF